MSAENDEATALLIRARAFIERGWCRDELARDVTGRPVYPTSQYAVSWCPWGALFAAGLSPLGCDSHYAPIRLQAAVGFDIAIVDFNNRQVTVKPVLAAFDWAIAARMSD